MQVKTELEERGTGDEKETYQQVDSCWALGDCSANTEGPLPALAQVMLLLSDIILPALAQLMLLLPVTNLGIQAIHLFNHNCLP